MKLLLEETFKSYNQHLYNLMNQVDVQALEDVMEILLKARENNNTIFFIGNGGSASTASHFAQDLALIGRKLKIKPFKSLSLTDNVSFITASGNDFGYDTVFSAQMEGLFQKDDILISISASGNSPNVIAASWFARQRGGKTIALVGFDGGKLKQICDHVIHVRSEQGEYGAVEDCHSILNHFLTSTMMQKLKKDFPDEMLLSKRPGTSTTQQPDLV